MDNDFWVQIYINYASSGFIPNVPTGILGLGWYQHLINSFNLFIDRCFAVFQQFRFFDDE